MVSLLTFSCSESFRGQAGMVQQQVDYRLLACRFHIFTPSFDNRPRHAGVPMRLRCYPFLKEYSRTSLVRL